MNCFCTAYSYLDIQDGGSGWLLWYGDLIDIRYLADNGQDIYIRMAVSELSMEKTLIGDEALIHDHMLIRKSRRNEVKRCPNSKSFSFES